MNSKSIISGKRSIIPACDVGIDKFIDIIKQTHNIEGVGAYKIGFKLGLGCGFPVVMRLAREHTNKPIIYDHQKAGTDIPDTGKEFAKVCRESGIDAVIIFPQSGPETQRAWIESSLEQGLGVIVGGEMTHKKYLRSEGGYIADEAVREMYLNATELGVTNFVVPGNKPESITRIKKALEEEGITPTFYAPGFIAQGGKISDAAKSAGENWHAIVGRGIYQAEDIRKATLEYTSQI